MREVDYIEREPFHQRTTPRNLPKWCQLYVMALTYILIPSIFFYICPFVQPSTKVCFCPCVVVLADKEPHCRVLRSRNHTDAHNLQAGYNWAYSTLLLYSHFHTLGTFTLVMAPCSHHNQSEWPAITKCGCNLVECQ